MKSRYPLLVVVLVSACSPPPDAPATEMESMLPALATRADSIAFRALEASGGEMAMRSLPYLRFDFGSESEAGMRVFRRHMWDRMSGDYRIEYQRGEDTTVVVLFNTQSREGTAYFNGAEAADPAPLVERAYGSFINDTYWLLMPTKMLDPGVSRSYVADSSDTETDAIRLTFDGVGLTPGDSYFVWINRETGMVKRWHYILQSGRQARWDWMEFRELDGPMGPVRLSERKQGPRSALMTNSLSAPATVADGMFTDGSPRLTGT